MPPAGSPRDRIFLEAALLRELALTWREISETHFRGALRAPVLTLFEGSHRLGSWHRLQRTLSLARGLVFGHPWGLVREVLKHEIAHQYVDEVLQIHDETAHGPAFARVCREHGIDARAAGLPAAGPHGGPDGSHPTLRRITRLLALAESPNLHEAEAAMNEARRLMLLHNIDAAEAAAADGYGYRHVGPVKARTEASERILAGILGRHFFVSAIWIPSYLAEAGRRGHVLELCGTPANLEVAAYVHAFLTDTAERLWREHKRALGIRSDQERRRFCAGVMSGFDEKLRAGERQSQTEGLVRHADAQREAYLRRRYPRRSTRSASAILRTAAYEQGRAAGGRVTLHRPVSSSAAAIRMLPPPRP
ncbi:MAG TPA: DUF2786 domain-containing protein [Polyangia bacterium]